MPELSKKFKNNVSVSLVQISQATGKHYYLPYAAGLLEIFVKTYSQFPERYQFSIPMFKPGDISAKVEALLNSNIVGLSVYIWNQNISLEIGRRLKQRKPEILLIFGGPQIPERSENFLRQHPYIDVCCHGEGEQTFLQLLDAYPQNHWDQIAGISYIDAKGSFQYHPPAPRMKNLDEIPSPILNQTFEPLLADNPDISWIGIWETTRGCPFTCTYCDWGVINAKVQKFEFARLEQEFKWFIAHHFSLVWSCDANFGILKRDEELLDKLLEIRAKSNSTIQIFFQQSKNTTERTYKILKKIYTSGLSKSINISLQTASPQAQKAIKRDNISPESYREIQKRLMQEGIPTYTEMIIGLPGETYHSFIRGISQLIREGQHHIISFYSLAVLPNSEMAQPEYREKYQLSTVMSPFQLYLQPIESPPDSVPEYIELVISHKDLSPQEWVKMRVFSWLTVLLYVKSKLFQLPILLTMNLGQVQFHEIIEFYMSHTLENYPFTQRLIKFLFKKANAILRGQNECVPTQVRKDFSAYVVVEEAVIIELLNQYRLGDFFSENKEILEEYITSKNIKLDQNLFAQACSLNQVYFMADLKKIDFTHAHDFNIWEIYENLKRDRPWVLKKGKYMCQGKIEPQTLRHQIKEICLT